MLKLFLSFSALGKLFLAGKVTEEDLRTGLYFLGCARVHVFGDESHPLRLDAEVEWGSDSACSELVADCHRAQRDPEHVIVVLRSAIAHAELEGRVVWRDRHNQEADQQAFRTMLEQHVGKMDVNEYEYARRLGNYPGTEELLKNAQVPVECVWR